ncbi:MAG: glycoside hydrolase [Planctomycetaceae bacterium]|nr:glycoside hydrolase [Planctomycetaceae bacterium]
MTKLIKHAVSRVSYASWIFVSLLCCRTTTGNAADIALNDLGYFEARGFSVMAFDAGYNGMFFDEKTSGVIMVHHGVRTATGGAVRLNPTPEQWDPIPTVADRAVRRDQNRIVVRTRYDDYDFESRLEVEAAGDAVLMRVVLDKPVPQALEGRAGLNLEFLPSAYFESTYRIDDDVARFPRSPASAMTVRPDNERLRQFAGHSTFDDHGRNEFIEPKPIAEGRTLILAPEDPARRVRIATKTGGPLQLLDGRNVAQNGWFVVRSLLPAGQTGTVVEWVITPAVIPNWVRAPNIGHSQVGYTPDQEKVAVIELDPHDKPLPSASVLRWTDEGEWVEALRGQVADWGDLYRYHYVRFDFSEIREPGLYRIEYGEHRSGPIPVSRHVLDDVWQPTLDVWFPVQMDHVRVNEAYRVWHGAAHLDDARQAPLNHQHFDGYRSGDSTETKYKPGERIPGLNIGGWFDAGDFDIRTGSHCGTVLGLAQTWDLFQPRRDETLVDQQRRLVDIHHPDGTPDLLQQIEHGTLALLAQHRAFGRAIPGIIVPHLHQYHHLGDGAAMTDNLPFNPTLKWDETDGVSSGTPDDRWAFTGKNSAANIASVAALAAAARALQDTNAELAEECLATAKRAWSDEQEQIESGDARRAAFRRGAEAEALLQLYISTGEQHYADDLQERLWSGLERNSDRLIGVAASAVAHLPEEFKTRLVPFVKRHKAANDDLLQANPYGVPITTRGWAGNSAVINWAFTNYLLHRAYPEIIGPEYVFRGLNYIYGCHPYSNVSFVSGVGLQSKTIAYGNNRADFSFIAGGVTPGVLLIQPDFLENKNDWPFLWGENEYVIDICADYIRLANAASDLVEKADAP